MARKMRPGILPKESAIKPGPVPHQFISFSFQYLDRQHPKFDFSEREGGYFCKVIERLSALCGMTHRELQTSRSASLKAHPIEWQRTSEPEGFANLNEQLRESTPYQFGISRNEHGRVHGFFIDAVFYVVWFDPDHQLYPGQ